MLAGRGDPGERSPPSSARWSRSTPEAPQAPARQYRFADGRGRIGVIPAVSQPFCGDCNRLRLTADGKLRNCLFAAEPWDVRALLRSGGSDDNWSN